MTKKFYMRIPSDEIKCGSEASNFSSKRGLIHAMEVEIARALSDVWIGVDDHLATSVKAAVTEIKEQVCPYLVLQCEVIGTERDFVDWDKVTRKVTSVLKKRQLAQLDDMTNRERDKSRVQEAEDRHAYQRLYSKFNGVSPEELL